MLLVLLVGFLAVSTLLVAVAWKAPRRAKIVGVLVVALSAPFFYWLGAFSEQFKAGLCYSGTITSIANAVDATDSPKNLAKLIRALPLEGYETSCKEVSAAAQALPNADAP